MNTIHFYGDSWTIEKDSEELIKSCVGYPSMVGEMLSTPIRNHAISGNSQLGMVDQFISSSISPGDHAVFSMSAPSRRFYLDEIGKRKNIPVDFNKESVNDYQDSWLSAITCAMLVDLGKKRDCRIWFVNLFNISYQEEWAHPLWKDISDENWLLPPDRCLIQEVFDPTWFSQFEIFRNSDFFDWLDTNNEQVVKCIRPCYNHPNLEGRKRIAVFIKDKLKDTFIIGESECRF